MSPSSPLRATTSRLPLNLRTTQDNYRKKLNGAWRKRPSPRPRPTIQPLLPLWNESVHKKSTSCRTTFRPLSASRSTKLSTFVTAKILTREQRCTLTAPAKESPTLANCKARNFPTTTSSTCRLHGILHKNLTNPSLPSSSTPILVAPRLGKLWRGPTNAPWNVIPYQ